MIAANNETALAYRGIHPNLDLALEHINADFLSRLGEERVDLVPGEVWCTKFTYETIPESEGFFEAHEDFLDIHLMLEGCERVDIAPPETLELFDAQPENDFYGYHGQGRHTLILAPGEFLVAFPADAHRIKLQADGPCTVTKAVFKIKIRSSKEASL